MPLTHFIFCCLPVQKKKKEEGKKKKKGGVEWGKGERRKRTVNFELKIAAANGLLHSFSCCKVMVRSSL